MDTRNDAIKPGAKVLLTYKGQDIATLDVESRWTPNKVGGGPGSRGTRWAAAGWTVGQDGGLGPGTACPPTS